MERKFRQVLGEQGNQPCVMRPWRYLTEINLIPLNKELHTKNTPTSQGTGDFFGNLSGTLQRQGRHGMRLPAFYIVSIYLTMANGLTEAGAVPMPHCQLGNLVIEVYETFHNNLAGTGAATLLGIVPGGLDVGFCFHSALPFAG